MLISEKCRRCQTQAGNFNLAYCSRPLESYDWFLLVTHISSHHSGVDAIIDGVRRSPICEHVDVSENRVNDPWKSTPFYP